MKSLTICLPDLVFDRAAAEAHQKGLELPSLCSGILADHLLTHFSRTPVSSRPATTALPKRKTPPPAQASISSRELNVAEHFKGFPGGSVRFAQAFVDEALKLPGVQAFPTSRGVGFRPNFVFIEYLMSRGGKAGIGVSFYGEPHRHENRPEILVRGIPSYSRAKIYSDADLRTILPHIRQSYELKFGKLSLGV
jgi:hypothetical protein